MPIYAVYFRYLSRHLQKETSIDDAQEFLRHGEQYGSLSSCGVIDTDNKKATVPIIYEKEFDKAKSELIENSKEEGYDISDYEFSSYETM